MNNNFSENIKKIRKENNLSQEQLAEELGVSRQAISKWESGAAYPEMDKIISICKKYNCNIDDLLHRDIKEVKGEEEAKKNANKYIEEFFKFITDSVNMFIRMKFWSKVKCLFEQFVIAFILMIAGKIIYGITTTIMNRSLLGFLPEGAYYRIEGFYESIFILIAFVVAVIIMVRIFKARYLDYYEQIVEEQKEEAKEKTTKVDNNSKIAFKEESKIVVRDPKHSDYHFLRGLLKVLLFFVKLTALWIALSLCGTLVCVGIGFILSFLVYKTGIFFAGCLLGCLSAGVALSIIILLLFNFTFNRKNNFKTMIWSFIGSVIVMGLSIGMLMVGSLQFNIENTPSNLKTETFEIAMSNDILLGDYDNIEYIVEERDNIRIEYTIDENKTGTYNITPNNVIHINSYYENQINMIRLFLKDLNDKNINIGDNIETIKVYASATNIEKLKTNHENYFNKLKSYENDINRLEEEIQDKNREIDELNQKIVELENSHISEE